jgi:hypothetical protein
MKINLRHRIFILAFAALGASAVRVMSAPDSTVLPNAADIYRRAFELLPKLTPDEERLLRGQASPADPEAVSRKLAPALERYRTAARMERCDWGVNLEKQKLSFQGLLPHLGPLNTLAGVAAWEAERVKTSDPAVFVALHEDAMRSAAHAGDGWPLVSGLIESAMRIRSLDALGGNLAALPPELLARLGAQLDAIPPCVEFHKAMLAEKVFGIDWFINRLVQVESGELAAEEARAGSPSFAANLRMSAMVDGAPFGLQIGMEESDGTTFWVALGQRKRDIELISADVQQGWAIVVKDGQAARIFLQEKRVEPIRLQLITNELHRLLSEKDAVKIIAAVGTNSTRLVEQLMEASDLLNAIAIPPARPVRDPGEWGKAIAGDMTNRNVIAAMYFPFAGAARACIDAAQAKEQMLRVAIDVLRKDPGVVERSRDPWGDGAFVYQKTTNGFELVSQLRRDGKPVTLNVKRR